MNSPTESTLLVVNCVGLNSFNGLSVYFRSFSSE